MTDLRTAAQQALEVLEAGTDVDPIFAGETEAALRAALAQKPAPAPTWKPAEWKRGCAVCGIGADGKAYGYVCPRLNCPTKVTFGGAV